MLKRTLKHLICKAASSLPHGAREALLDEMANSIDAHRALAKLAKNLRVSYFGAGGKWGPIISSADDLVILPRYADTGDWSPELLPLVEAFFNGSNGLYLDIGANIGLTTIPVARNPFIQCIAFEPDPTNFLCLSINVRSCVQNNNVTLHQLALLDADGPVSLSLASDGNIGDHRIGEPKGTHGSSITVEGRRLDDVLEVPSCPLAIKIDTQGAEPAVIAGGRAIMDQAGLVVMEFSPSMMMGMGGDVSIVLDYLATFSQIAIAKGDAHEAIRFRPAVESCEKLHHFNSVSKFDANAYLDVYALRSSG